MLELFHSIVLIITLICITKGDDPKSFIDELSRDDSVNYCDYSKEHLLCEEFDPMTKRVGECKKQSTVKVIPFNQTEKDDIIKSFNQYRNELAKGGFKFRYNPNDEKPGEDIPYEFPAASNMLKIEWEPLLAIAAARKALTCSRDDSCPECLQFGQELIQGKELHPYSIEFGRMNYRTFIDGEYRNFPDTAEHILNYSKNENYDFFSTPSYSQSRFIGCARVEAKTWIDNRPYKMLETCIIAPSELDHFNLLYLQGEPCSNCPEDFACDEEYPALCRGNKGGLEYHPIIEDYHRTMNAHGKEKSVPNILNEDFNEEDPGYEL